MFPSADQIALAIVTACRLVGGASAPLIALGAVGGIEGRPRHVALAALLAAFPEARRAGLARCCGYPPASVGGASSNIGVFRNSHWWDESWVDEIVGLLVADSYGERAS